MDKANLNFVDEVPMTAFLMPWWKAEWLQKDPYNFNKTLLNSTNSNQIDFLILTD